MNHYRNAVLAGVCSACLGFQFGAADIGHATSSVEAPSSFDARPIGFPSPEFYSDRFSDSTGLEQPELLFAEQDSADSSSKPAWAAEATMNPDYVKDDATAGAASGDEQNVADASAPPPTGGQATTSFYGGSKATDTPAWAQEAKMNPDYSSGASSSGSAIGSEPAAADSARSAAVEECRSEVTDAIKSARLHFREAGYGLSPETRAALSKVARALKNCRAVIVEIAGHTDNVGSPEGNKALSTMRAREVVEFLISAGVDANKLKAVGRGQDNPVADNSSASGRAMNRRVEVQISGQ